jgi:hypothetical protein
VLYKDVFRPELNVAVQSYDMYKVSVFPNPTTDYLSLSGLAGNEILEIYSMSGKLMLSTISHANIDLRDFSSGAYILRIIKDNEHFATLKFIKQ